MRSKRITVIGAGPAGALLSIYLARRGYEVTVYERRPDLRRARIPAGRSINLALANRGMHALAEVGLMDRVKLLLIPMRGRMIHADGGGLRFQPYGHKPHEVIYSVSRSGLTALLMEAAESGGRVAIRFNHTCQGVDLERHRLRLRDDRKEFEIAFDRIIGCDGIQSRIRQTILHSASGHCEEEPLAHGYKELSIPAGENQGFRMEAKALHIWPRGDHMLIALPNLGGGFTATLFLPEEGDPSFAALCDGVRLRAFFRQQFPDALAIMPRLAREFFRHPTGRLSTIRTHPWHFRDEALILGDAAHAIVPFHGQGMNCAFEDCSALNDCLARSGDDWESALAEFEDMRKPNADAIADLSLENYLEMRSSVRDPRFQLQKELAWRLEDRYPNRFIPRYSMVMFHRIPYAEAKRRGAIQDEILDALTASIHDLDHVDYVHADRLIEERLGEAETSMSHLGDEDLSPLLSELAARIDGEVHADSVTRMLYAVDASPYQEQPLGAVRPRHGADCAAIVRFAARHRIPLIPRAAGTSLAGQCVGNGLVVDVSRYMTDILEIDCERRRARVQPGVILEDLNDALAPNGLMFGPDTSTANRCMIGGMIGNNACGSHSILYGTTRDHVLEVEAVLGDGSVARFGPLDKNALQAKLGLDTLEGRIYREVFHAVDDHRVLILDRYPGPDVLRRNTGYALDVLARGQPWATGGPEFNLAPFLCGSEGTLAIITEAALNLVVKPASRLLVCAHFESLDSALRGTLVAVRHQPAAVELVDRRILEPTRGHLEQRHNRFWIEGDPEAVLIIELCGAGTREVEQHARDLVDDLQRIGYAFPVVGPPRMSQVWELRAAGLGLLMGVPGDMKAVTVIEDTAVAVAELPEYVRRIQALMEKYQTRCVYYGHASVGLLHLRPELDLKQPEGIEKFKALAAEVADLVAELGGSLSGEHGDGRLRGPFVARMLGKEIYEILCRIKSVFDPEGIFNPHKVTAAFPIDRDLRVKATRAEIPVYFDWSADQGFLRAAEKCNGAGACRKRAGRGTMCPSYMATLEEKHTTRGRANVFRQVLSSPDPLAGLTRAELREVLDLCLACKGCKSECPATVDMARMKAEFLQHYQDRHGVPLRARVLGGFGRLNRMAARFPEAATALINHTWVKRLLGIHEQRRIPALARQTFSRWFSTREQRASSGAGRDVLLFNDLFTEFHEPGIGIAAAGFLERAGYRVGLTRGIESGRVQISQGFLHQAKGILNRSIAWLYPHAAEGTAVLGLEPSEILTFRDEAPDLVASHLRAQARTVAGRTLLFEEFIAEESRAGKLGALAFDQNPCHVLVHGHCHQKALAGMQPLLDALAILPHAQVETIPSGCCGMAGAFGYEREHYEVSMRIGELVLFPAVRGAAPETLIVAPGTSCRHQIADGTGRRAYHPAELLWQRQV